MDISRTFRLFAIFGALLLLQFCHGCSETPTSSQSPPVIPPSLQPREVPFVEATHGPDPGEVEISWMIINWASHPIEEYIVAMSDSGPVTEENWDQAVILDQFIWRPGQAWFHQIFGPDDNLEQGMAAWFAVRARDSEGLFSRLGRSPHLTLTREWWIEGHVFIQQGIPAEGIFVTDPATRRSGRTDAEGFFRVGPFRNIDRVALNASDPVGSWYDCSRSPVVIPPGRSVMENQDLYLIPRFHQDSRCTAPDTEFLSYLRRMTYTTPRENNPAASILHRWEQYPLTVHIPSAMNETGVSMGEAALAAILLWNNVMGEEYFVRTDDRSAANIEFHFEDMEHRYGLVSLLTPSWPGAELGRVIPTKMKVSIDTGLPSTQTVTEVSLHELGHVLGLLNHSECGPAGYLMNIAGGFGALSKVDPVHYDERRAVECIRYLPQGQDMGAYE